MYEHLSLLPFSTTEHFRKRFFGSRGQKDYVGPHFQSIGMRLDSMTSRVNFFILFSIKIGICRSLFQVNVEKISVENNKKVRYQKCSYM